MKCVGTQPQLVRFLSVSPHSSGALAAVQQQQHSSLLAKASQTFTTKFSYEGHDCQQGEHTGEQKCLQSLKEMGCVAWPCSSLTSETVSFFKKKITSHATHLCLVVRDSKAATFDVRVTRIEAFGGSLLLLPQLQLSGRI